MCRKKFMGGCNRTIIKYSRRNEEKVNLIVAVDKNWAIGNKNRLLVNIPEDMQLFRQETVGKAVVMGRKTLESLPGGQPLKNRTNVVITGNLCYSVNGAVICHSVKEALEVLKAYNDRDIYVAGGESIYRQFLPYCNVAHVTKVNYVYEADTYFPNLEESGEWEITSRSDERTYFDLEYEFLRFERKNKEEKG